MAAETKTYDGVPLGAVFEAGQRSLRTLNFKIKEEKIEHRIIRAKSKVTMSSFGQDIVLQMDEIGQATELKITTSSGQLSDWGEGEKIIKSILLQIDIEVEKLRDAGRIEAVVAPKYGFGESPVMDRGTTTENSGEKEGFGKTVLKIIAACLIGMFLFGGPGKELVSSLLRSVYVEYEIYFSR